MQKYIQTTILASATLLLANTAQAKTASEIYEQAAKSTVVVRNFDAKGKQQSMGSGVVMPDGDVVTNCHVVKGASRLTVRVGKTERPATLRFSDWDRDVCTLSSTGLNAPSATVGSSKTLKVGAKVYAIGAPKELELTLSEGIVSSLRDLEGGRYIQTTAAISPGSSGGGLYDDNGALVGLTTFYFTEGQSLNFAIPIDWVKDLPKRNVKIPQTVQTTTAWLFKAAELENRKDWGGLLAHTLSWTKGQPNSDQAWFGLGSAHANLKQISQAIDAYQQGLRINPERSDAWYNLGIAYSKTKQFPQAINAYQQALRIKPEANTWSGLGTTYAETKEYFLAINAYQQALNINPKFFAGWYNLGSVYSAAKEYPQAISAYEQALRIDPVHHDAWFNFGNAYYNAKQYSQAINAYQQAMHINPENASVWYSLGGAYSKTKQFPQAINAYQQALIINPKHTMALGSLGNVYYSIGERGKVLEVYKKLKALDPAVANIFFDAFILPGG